MRAAKTLSTPIGNERAQVDSNWYQHTSTLGLGIQLKDHRSICLRAWMRNRSLDKAPRGAGNRARQRAVEKFLLPSLPKQASIMEIHHLLVAWHEAFTTKLAKAGASV